VSSPFRIRRNWRSPNYDSRPAPPLGTVDAIMLHGTGGAISSALSWLCTERSHVSAHYVIGKSGSIYELVDPDKRAWHAGEGYWDVDHDGKVDYGETSANAWSIGYEFENTNSGHDPWPAKQILSGAWLARRHRRQYPQIKMRNIIRHKDYAPGRKVDVAENFPLDKFKKMVMNTDAFIAERNRVYPPPPPPVTDYTKETAPKRRKPGWLRALHHHSK
jgi:N-acetylmuramoyl-L-alanine amidase